MSLQDLFLQLIHLQPEALLTRYNMAIWQLRLITRTCLITRKLFPKYHNMFSHVLYSRVRRYSIYRAPTMSSQELLRQDSLGERGPWSHQQRAGAIDAPGQGGGERQREPRAQLKSLQISSNLFKYQ